MLIIREALCRKRKMTKRKASGENDAANRDSEEVIDESIRKQKLKD